jgi:hypothetical protein
MVHAQFSYTTNSNVITIRGYDGTNADVTIPDWINGYPVTIATGLGYCPNLTTVTIGTNLTTIGSRLSNGCGRLRAITVDAKNPAFSSVAGVLFDKSQHTIIEYPEGMAGSYSILDGVTSIGDSAFQGCYGLTNVIISSSVETIGSAAFNYCTSLTSLAIPNNVAFIGNWAFEDCTGLTSVIIGTNVTIIGRRAFCDCPNLTSVTIPNSVTNIWDGAFEFCTGLSSVTIPNSVTFLDGYVFCGCSSLNCVTLPDTIATIGDGLFYWCASLTNVTVPDSVTSVGQWAFRECPSLASVTVGTNVSSVGDYAFYECPSLTEVFFRGNVPVLGSAVFDGDSNVTIYYLPETAGWNPQIQTGDASFGVRTNCFGFSITGTSTLGVLVEACTNLADPAWFPVSTNVINGGSSYFSDSDWTNYPSRFYRLGGGLTVAGRPAVAVTR